MGRVGGAGRRLLRVFVDLWWGRPLPGPTLSDGVAEMMKGEVERTGKSLEAVMRDFVLEQRPSSIIQRASSVEEVANMIVYVCSTQASATTGAALRVDGGVVDDIV